MKEFQTNQTRSVPLTFKEDNTCQVVISTGERVYRGGFKPYWEELEISREAIDFSRLNNGAPLLDSHKSNSVRDIIGVVESASAENHQAVATIRFSDREDVKGIVQDVRNGIIKSVSIGYRINKFEKVDEVEDVPVYRATNFTIYEVSLVGIPADSQAQIRSNEQTETIIEKDTKMDKEVLDEIRLEAKPEIDAQALIAQERTRIAEISKLVRSAGLDTIMAEDLIAQGSSVDQARSVVLDEVIKRQPKITNTTTTVDSGEKFRSGVEAAILMRCGLEKNDTKNEFRGMSLMRMAEEALTLSGQNARGLQPLALAQRALHSTSDFPYALMNVANKSLMKAYETAPETWQQLVRVISVPDFKQMTMVGGSEFSTLDEVPESAEYKYGTMSDTKETFGIATYGKLFAITRQALVNDDINYFTDVPAKMGRAAARKVGDLVWQVFTANAAMSDGVALFHANHKNLGTGAITIASIDAARTAMATQKDASNLQALNIRPSFLITPVALETAARTLMISQNDPDATSKIRPNPFSGAFTVVSDARLDTNSTAVWYLSADPAVIDTVVVGYLDGNSTPYLEQEMGFNIDGLTYKCRIDCAAKAVGYRRTL